MSRTIVGVELRVDVVDERSGLLAKRYPAGGQQDRGGVEGRTSRRHAYDAPTVLSR